MLVAPSPLLAWFLRPDYWMTCGRSVFTSVLVDGVVTTPGLPAGYAESEMNPGIADGKTLDTTTGWHWIQRNLAKFWAYVPGGFSHRVSE